MRTVWIISEGSPGHVSQSTGLVAALQEQLPLEVRTFETRPRLSGVARSCVRLWMGSSGRALPQWMLRRWLQLQPTPAAEQKPDLIVCSGGKSVFAARSIAARTGAPLVFLGERKPYRPEWFHTVFTPSEWETGPNDVLIEMIPTQITAASVAAASANWVERPAGRLWAMIVGGASRSHNYSTADWQALATGMNRVATQHGIRWLITTSRRSGPEAEHLLRSGLQPEHLGYAIWWAEKPERKMAAFMGAAESVCVTQDSVTMVTEAVASARPVFLLRPAKVTFPPDSFLPGYFARLEKQGWVRRLEMAGLGTADLSCAGFRPRRESITAELAARLLARLPRGF